MVLYGTIYVRKKCQYPQFWAKFVWPSHRINITGFELPRRGSKVDTPRSCCHTFSHFVSVISEIITLFYMINFLWLRSLLTRPLEWSKMVILHQHVVPTTKFYGCKIRHCGPTMIQSIRFDTKGFLIDSCFKKAFKYFSRDLQSFST